LLNPAALNPAANELFQLYGSFLERRATLQHATEYAFFECGKASAAAGSRPRQVYNLVQGYAAALN